jgi:uncharacterized protein (UPF0333 family)
MNLKLLVGIVLFVIGLVTAAVGIVGVGGTPGPTVAVEADQNQRPFSEAVANVAIPAVAGLSLAVGGLLIGLSMGNWKHPRTHLEPGDEVVDPEGYHKMKHV